MKSFLVIGLNSFGTHLCRELYEQGSEVMIADKKEERLEDALKYSISAKVGDCSDEDVLRSFGVGNFDCCFVCIGDSFQDSLQVTSLLKELGAKKVISKASNEIHTKFLLRNGADSVIYPDKDTARTLAISEVSDNIFDCIPLTDEYFIYEISPDAKWSGKTLKELNLRAGYKLNVLAVKRNGVVDPMPYADHVISADEHLVVLGRAEDIKKINSRK
ncbi:MAG: TrkA family potassium uptake protein [Oscillospiraceae bacterium]|nr:TrkA family potassium uptake protein [Oscillospiraceae bacterium]